MKRLHVHVSVDDLAQSVRFYTALFVVAAWTKVMNLDRFDLA